MRFKSNRKIRGAITFKRQTNKRQRDGFDQVMNNMGNLHSHTLGQESLVFDGCGYDEQKIMVNDSLRTLKDENVKSQVEVLRGALHEAFNTV
ncbi:hypothetical protein M9H77_18535 [Catharanthus roseus]|uniref:Uncharacterized protein n=1 Tax=Catharanthus roseus TaxID=4058 RepID=A0ACC0B7S9_CATRO|nr:hypothetical protein M9H77_18535 [Catharanthus roseus]